MKLINVLNHPLSDPQYFSDYIGAAEVNVARGVLKAACDLMPKIDLRFPEIPGRIGIELEAENGAPAYRNWRLSPFWYVKEDGSLRNCGAEFVSPALSSNHLAFAISLLYGGISKWAPDLQYTERTSVHVHLECAHMETDQFKNLILLYLVYENSLFQFASPGRRDTNIFCTPLGKTNFYGLYSFFHAQTKAQMNDALQVVFASIHKYAALNFLHIVDYGTLEFRHLRGTGDPVLLARWVKLLTELYKAAITIPTEEIHRQIMSLNTTSAYANFMEMVFGDAAEYLKIPMYKSFMSEGISIAKEVLAKKLTIPTPSEKGGVAIFLASEEKKLATDRLADGVLKKYKQYKTTILSPLTGSPIVVDLRILASLYGVSVGTVASCPPEKIQSLYWSVRAAYATELHRANLQESNNQ